MRLWRFQKCPFCGDELKDFKQVVYLRNWTLHYDCEQTIRRVRKKRNNYNTNVYRLGRYIRLPKHIYGNTNHQLVFQ